MPWANPVGGRRPAGLALVAVLAFVTAAFTPWRCAPAQSDGGRATLLEVDGAIGPAVVDYVRRGLEDARDRGDQLVILRLDTPGGLDSSMRDMVRDIIASEVPVVGYVAPRGARAASAGTYILYACHVAAMAPATTLGAATPVSVSPGGLGGDAPRPSGKGEEGDDAGAAGAMERKAVNDAAAYIRGLADLRGRNAQWAELAVREAASLGAAEALEQGVVDLVAEDVAGLLAALDGRQVDLPGGALELGTQGLIVVPVVPDWRSRLLALITDPNVAYILLLLGIYGLFFELANPGSVLPGVAGAICLLLGLYAFQVLPVSYAGLALVAIGVAFMVAEVFVPSFGALGIGGLVAFVVGSLMLMDEEAPGYALSVPLVLGFGIASAGFFLVVLSLVARSRRRPVVSGREELPGAVAVAVDGFTGEGRVRLRGEVWLARSVTPVGGGQKVRVTGVDGLTLEVRPLPEEEP